MASITRKKGMPVYLDGVQICLLRIAFQTDAHCRFPLIILTPNRGGSLFWHAFCMLLIEIILR